MPVLVATFKIPHKGHALQIGEGLDRDRAVDESGHQIAVFGRVGARPLNLDEQQRMYREPLTPKNARLMGVEPAPLWKGPIFQVSDDPYDGVYLRTADVPPGLLTVTLSVPAVAWVQESAMLLLVCAVLLILVGAAFWWMWRRESRL